MATTSELTVDGDTIALWRMNGTSNAAVKKENAEGTATYDLTEENTPGVVDGFDGATNGGYDFEEASDESCRTAYITIPSSFTIEAWIKPESFSNTPFVVAGGGGSQISWGMRLSSSGYLTLFYNDGTNKSFADDTTPLSTGNWYYVAVVHDSSANENRLYVNGDEVKVFGSATTDSTNPDTERTRIGGHPSGTPGAFNMYDGVIDEVRISGIARTATEIYNYYNDIVGAERTDRFFLMF